MKTLLYIAKVIGAVAAISGAALWFDARFDDNAQKLDDVQEMVEYINIEQSIMAGDIQDNKDTLEEMAKENSKQTESIKSITWILKNQDNFTQEQLEEIMEEMMRKSSYTRGPGEVTFIPIE